MPQSAGKGDEVKHHLQAAFSPALEEASQREFLMKLPDDMQWLLCIVEGLESVLALKRGAGSKYILFRDDKEGIEIAAKRSFKVRQVLLHYI